MRPAPAEVAEHRPVLVHREAGGARPPRRRTGALTVLLAVTVCVDVALLAAGLEHSAASPAFSHWRWDGDQDGSYAEILGHAQLSLAVVLLVALAATGRMPVHLAWALVLAFGVADDALLVHERHGGRIGDALSLTSRWGLRDQDLGELVFLAAVAVTAAALLAEAHVRSGPAARADSWVLVRCTAVLAVLSVGLDMSAYLLGPLVDPDVTRFLTPWETAAELIGMTVVMWQVLRMTVRPRADAP